MSSAYIRKACATLALLGSAALLCAQRAPQKSPPSWFWGCWVVKRNLAVRDISGLSQKQVDAIIGTRIFFSPSCARSGGTVIKSPTYSLSVLSNAEFFTRRSYVDLSEIGVRGQQVTEVAVRGEFAAGDVEFPGADVYLRERDIVIEVENVYLLAERAKPGDPSCGCEAPPAR